MHNFYPAGHPNLDRALDNCFSLLEKELSGGGEIGIHVDQKGFYRGKNPLAPGNKELVGLARKLFYRKMKELTITPRVTRDELKAFLSLLDIEPEDLRAAGGVEQYIARMDIKGILLNEMRFEDLLKLQEELRKKEEARSEEKVEAPEGISDEAEEEPPPPVPEEEAPIEDSLSDLIGKLSKETDLLRYNDLAVRVWEKAGPLISKRRFDELFPLLRLFLRHASPASNLQVEIRSIALERLDTVVKDPTAIPYLVNRAGRKDEEHRAEVQKMLIRGGDPAIEAALDALVDAPEASIRRNLFNTVVKFKEKLLPHIESRLKSEQWYVQRQMLAILGEIGDPSTIDLIISAYGNPDPRVKREVFKSLARIPSPKSTAFMVSGLAEEDTTLKTQAIISLGMLRDPSAVERLAEIALKWEPFADRQDPVKEAIKALGIIGDRSAVPHLIKVLTRKKWFGKKANEDLKVLAATALASLGGEEAIKAIERTAEHSSGDLYTTCKRILEGREKKE